MDLYPKETWCPHCKVRGRIKHVPGEVIPRKAFCGNCRVVFDYPKNRYDHIIEDYDGDQNIYYFEPKWRAPVLKPEPEPPVPEPSPLKEMPTALLLRELAYVRAYGEQPEYGRCFSYEELKEELATREHIPNKQEGKELRRKKAQMHHGSSRKK